MSNDLVINSYEEQIKESLLKAQAIKIAGFDLIIAELQRRSIDCSSILAFFTNIENAKTKDEINSFTIDDLNKLIDDVNIQVTRALISAVEVADSLLRKSRAIALEKSPNGKISDSDNYIRVGSNLSSEIQQHGISHGLNICVRNYCIQKMYQATYREKIKERKIKLGIYDENEGVVSKKKNSFSVSKVSKILREIFNKDNISSSDKNFEEIKVDYFNFINDRVSHLSEYK